MPSRWLDRNVLTWSLYDVATSVWIAAIPTVLYALYFRAVVVDDPSRADALWGLAAGMALLSAGLIAPWVGARADLHGSRSAWMAAATALCAASTAAMGLVGPGQVLLGVLLYVAAQVGYTVGMALYDAYLVRMARGGNAGRISSFGWAMGFVGGIAGLLVCLAILRGAELAQHERFAATFVAVGAMTALLAWPAIVGLRRMDDAPALRADNAAQASALLQVAASARAWRRHPNALKFLAALFLINDAVVTVSLFAIIYLREQFGVGLTDLIKLALLYQCLAIPATLAFGRFADRASPHAAIFATLLGWTGALLLMAFGSGAWVPVTVIALFAAVFGATQSLMRGMYALIVPHAHAGEFFGFNALAGRLSAAIGPLLYALVSTATGSPRAALLSVLVFLLAGALVLASVRIEAPAEDDVQRAVQ